MMQIDVPTLTKMVNEMKYDLRIFFAARYLQRWWRIKSLKLLDSRTLHIRNAAASKLQHMWKVFRWRQMQHKITNHKSNKASVQIQKFMRGLTIAKKVEHVYIKMRMTDHINYFDQMKKGMRYKALHLIKDKMTALLRRSYSQCLDGLIEIKREDDEARKAGKGPIRSKVGPYIKGKTNVHGGAVKKPGSTSNRGGYKKSQADSKSNTNTSDQSKE